MALSSSGNYDPLGYGRQRAKILESRAREIAAKIIATSEVPLKYMIVR